MPKFLGHPSIGKHLSRGVPVLLRPAAQRALLILLMLLSATTAAARELLAVGTYSEKIFIQDGDGRYAGLGVDIIRLVARNNGDTVHFAMYPWPRAVAMVAHGQADILIGPYKTAQRETLLAYTRQPFYQDQIRLYALDGALGRRQPAAVRLALLNGRDYGEDFARATGTMPVIVTNDVDNALRMLAIQRVDLFAVSRRNAEPAIARMGWAARLKPVAQLPQQHDGYFAFSNQPQADALRRDFETAFNRLIKNGMVRQLVKRYGITPSEKMPGPCGSMRAAAHTPVPDSDKKTLFSPLIGLNKATPSNEFNL